MEGLLFNCEGDRDMELVASYALRKGTEDDTLYEPSILDTIFDPND